MIRAKSSTLSITDEDKYNITLSCTASGSPPDTFIWMKDGDPITQSTDITTVTHNSTSAVFGSNYTIENFNISDDGMYTCTVTNPIGSDSANFSVTVVGMFIAI